MSSRLSKANSALQNQKNASARDKELAQNEKKELEQRLEEAETRLQHQEEARNQLREEIKAQEGRREDLQKALSDAGDLRISMDFYGRKDGSSTKVISSLQQKVKALQSAERSSGFATTIKKQKAEIAKLISHQEKLQKELEKHQRISADSLTKIVEHVKLTTEASRKFPCIGTGLSQEPTPS